MAGERIIGKKIGEVVDFASRLNARNVDRAVQASSQELSAIVPGAGAYSRFFDFQALRETVEEFDDLPEDGAVAVFKHDTIGELVDGYHKGEIPDEYRTNVASTIDEIRERVEANDVMWDSPVRFNASWDDNLDMIVDLDDSEMQALEAAYKYMSIHGPDADARAPIALNFENGPWEFEGFEDGDWLHSGRVIFRDSEGNTVLEKTVDDFDFPFAQDLRARRDPEKTAEWIKNWTSFEAKESTAFQPLGQPKPRDAMIETVLDLDDDVIDYDALDRQMQANMQVLRQDQIGDDFAMEEQREFLRRFSGWGKEEPLSYEDYLYASQQGLLPTTPPYKSDKVLSSEAIENAGRNIIEKEMYSAADTQSGIRVLNYTAKAQYEGALSPTSIGDLQLHVAENQGTIKATIKWSSTRPAAAGKGLGLRLYGAAVKFAKENNAELLSDDSVSGDAVRMYEAMVRRGGVIEDQRVVNPSNVEVTMEEWLPGKLVPQFRTRDGSPLIRVTKLPEKLPAVMLPVAPLSYQEQQFVENSPYQRIMYDVDGDNPYLFRGRQPFKVGVRKGATPSEVAQSMLGYNGFKDRERRDLKVIASGVHGEEAEQVLYNVLARTGFDHILHAPDGQVTYWDDKLALPRKQEQ